MAVTIFAAYTVFGLTGFGAALVAVPVLVQIMPLQLAVPSLLILDLVSTTAIAVGNRRKVCWRELARLAPFLVAGVGLGATALAGMNSRWLLLALGVFVIGIAIHSLLATEASQKAVSGAWAAPAGFFGGIFGGLFSTGGPFYTMYLVRRLPFEEFRATMAAVIFTTAALRLFAFVWTGLVQQPGFVYTAIAAIPFGLAGLALGSRLRHQVPQRMMRKLVIMLLLIAGTGVIVRALG